MPPKPDLWLVAGCNGAGKTTVTKKFGYIPPELVIINPDEITKELGVATGGPSRAVEIRGGRKALQRRETFFQERKSFAVETTLSGKRAEQLVLQGKDRGYALNLVYVGLDSADLAVRRVGQRVRQGGHNVPESYIRRRYERSLKNLKTIFHLVDNGVLIDNSDRIPRRVGLIIQGKMLFTPSHNCRWLNRLFHQG